jgi:thiamine biosynthesis lipoprotein
VSGLLADIDTRFSSQREDSEVSRLNAQETTDWLPVSGEMARLVGLAHAVYEHSDGCYDLTASPLSDLWGLARRQNRVPSQEEVDALLPHTGMTLLEVDADKLRIRKKDPKLKMDLSSLAQAYSVGEVARRLETLGVNNYRVEIGSEIMVKGRKANGNPWRVGVETTKPLTLDLERNIGGWEQAGLAVMRAGAYRKAYQEEGRPYPLVINPKTGWPVTHQLRSVAVMHADPAWANAWAAALLCVGEQEAARIAEAEKLKALFVYGQEYGLSEHMSKAFVASN